jgi:hypothetical protein
VLLPQIKFMKLENMTIALLYKRAKKTGKMERLENYLSIFQVQIFLPLK